MYIIILIVITENMIKKIVLQYHTEMRYSPIFLLQTLVYWKSKKIYSLLFCRSVHPSQLDITGERKILLRRLQHLNQYERMMIEQQMIQMNLQQDVQVSGQPPAGQ